MTESSEKEIQSEPYLFSLAPTREEIRNIPEYIKKGWLLEPGEFLEKRS